MATKPRELRYAVDLAVSGQYVDEKGVGLEVPSDWTPEHLLLAALMQCSLASFEHHVTRAGLELGARSGTARTMITRRESDGRYAVVEAELELSVEIAPEADDLTELLAKAERDCFVGASLTATPSYRWTVNGQAIAA